MRLVCVVCAGAAAAAAAPRAPRTQLPPVPAPPLPLHAAVLMLSLLADLRPVLVFVRALNLGNA